MKLYILIEGGQINVYISKKMKGNTCRAQAMLDIPCVFPTDKKAYKWPMLVLWN